MAVSVQYDALASECWRFIAGCAAYQEFAEQERLLAKPLCTWICGKEIQQLVAEDTGTTRFQKNKCGTSIDLWCKAPQNCFEIAACLFQKSEVIKWASAADVML